jgi:hypothetical protein
MADPGSDIQNPIGVGGGVYENSAVDWVQQMHDLEAIQWRGGDSFWGGEFCSFDKFPLQSRSETDSARSTRQFLLRLRQRNGIIRLPNLRELLSC